MFKVFTRLPRMVRNLRTIVSDGLSFFASVCHRRKALAAENLFLRKQLALFREREKKAMPTTPADRFVFSKLARWFDWRSALLIIKPATLIGWHRNAFRVFWRWKSRPLYQDGLEQLSPDEPSILRAQLLSNRANALLAKHLFPQAENDYIEARAIFTLHNNSRGLAKINIGIAEIARQQGRPIKAYKLGVQALRFRS